jgi:hypothetical protein
MTRVSFVTVIDMVFIPLFCLPWLLSVFEEDEWDEVDQDDDDEDDDDDDDVEDEDEDDDDVLLVIALFESKLEGVTTLWLLPVSSTCVL